MVHLKYFQKPLGKKTIRKLYDIAKSNLFYISLCLRVCWGQHRRNQFCMYLLYILIKYKWNLTRCLPFNLWLGRLELQWMNTLRSCIGGSRNFLKGVWVEDFEIGRWRAIIFAAWYYLDSIYKWFCVSSGCTNISFINVCLWMVL
jgi:hypothetical protein